MDLATALQETGIAEAYYDGKTIVVREDENERYEDVLVLAIKIEEMPPYSTQEFKTLDEVIKEIKEHTYFPDSILSDFSVVEVD